MADKISREERSRNMSRIRSKDTSIEKRVRKQLFKMGFRYRKNVVSLPGKPDIVLPKYRTVVFVHGCFWHRHENCKIATIPKTHTEYWVSKFNRTIKRDEEHKLQLEKMGWNVIVIWECELLKDFDNTMDDLIENLVYENDIRESQKSPAIKKTN